MPIARITGSGLMAIALSVAALWGCIIGERLMVKHSTQERARIMRDLHRLRRIDPEPVSVPVRPAPLPDRPIAG